jgi:hypothetical protein
MGVFDDIFGPDEEEIKKAYADGVRDYDKAGLLDHIEHGIADTFNNELHWRDKKGQAYEAGWHDRENGKVDWKKSETKSSPSYSSSGSSYSSSGSGSVSKGEEKILKFLLYFIIGIIAVAIFFNVLFYIIAIIYALLTQK